MPRRRDPNTPVRAYVRVTDERSMRAVALVRVALVPVATVAALYGLRPAALYGHVNRAPPTTPAMVLWAEAAVANFAVLGRFAEPPSRVYWFGSSIAASAQSFQGLLRTLMAARRTLDVFVFTWTSDPLAQLAVELVQRGVLVRVLLCRSTASGRWSQMQRLRLGGALVYAVGGRTLRSLAHHKYAVVDGRVVVEGSFNWSDAATRQNLEHLSVHTVPRLANEFASQFAISFAQASRENDDGE